MKTSICTECKQQGKEEVVWALACLLFAVPMFLVGGALIALGAILVVFFAWSGWRASVLLLEPCDPKDCKMKKTEDDKKGGM